MRVLLFTLVFCNLGQFVCGQDSLTRFQYSTPSMGTEFKLTFYTHSKDNAQAAAEKAFLRIDELNQIFSDYLGDSEASELAKKAGSRVSASDDFWYLIKFSKKLSRQTGGAFDITAGPVTKLWRRAIRQQVFPDSGKIVEARNLVNYRWIKLYPSKQQIKLKKTGMKLDFGAIAKGYAIDQAYRVLGEFGITIALVDGGGDLYIGESPPFLSNWDIKDHQGNALTVAPHSGVASSGDSYQKLDWNGSRYSHIVDPRSGIGLQNSLPVTVLAASATIADALSSSLSVLDERSGKKLLRKYRAQALK